LAVAFIFSTSDGNAVFDIDLAEQMAPATMSSEMAKIPTRESNQTVMTE
jgi:hypothetical protein